MPFLEGFGSRPRFEGHCRSEAVRDAQNTAALFKFCSTAPNSMRCRPQVTLMPFRLAALSSRSRGTARCLRFAPTPIKSGPSGRAHADARSVCGLVARGCTCAFVVRAATSAAATNPLTGMPLVTSRRPPIRSWRAMIPRRVGAGAMWTRSFSISEPTPPRRTGPYPGSSRRMRRDRCGRVEDRRCSCSSRSGGRTRFRRSGLTGRKDAEMPCRLVRSGRWAHGPADASIAPRGRAT